MLAFCSLLVYNSCENSDEDAIENGESWSYTFYDQTYYPSKYFPSSIGEMPSSAIYTYKDRDYYWAMDLCGCLEGDRTDGRFIEFKIFSQNVKSGFEFTSDNFAATIPNYYANDFNHPTYYKKSGSCKITKMDDKKATIVFKDFVLKADLDGYPDIPIKGTAVIDVD